MFLQISSYNLFYFWLIAVFSEIKLAGFEIILHVDHV